MDQTEPPSYAHRLDGPCNCGNEHGVMPVYSNGHGRAHANGRTPESQVVYPDLEAVAQHYQSKGLGTIVAFYDYCDEQGQLLFKVLRFDPKTFRQIRPVDGGWVLSLEDSRLVLYRLPELKAADKERWVFVTEGEKDANALAERGFIATTNPGGAGKWQPEYTEMLRGRSVVLLPDRDKAGQSHRDTVMKAIHGAPKDLRVLELPEKDVSAWLDANHSVDELKELVLAAPLGNPVAELAEVEPVVEAVPEPEPEPTPPPVFPLETLPEAAVTYANRLAEGGLPMEFLGPAALAVLAGAVGGMKTLEIAAGSWVESLVLWFVIVGDPGTGKSPSITNLRRPLQEVEQQWAMQHADALNLWELLPDKEKKLVPEPIRRRMLVGDTTIEALARRLNENLEGLLLVADELRSLIHGLGQYKRSGGADRAAFLALWTPDSITVDRASDSKGRNIYVARPIVSMLGGIQPALLHVLEGPDGLRDRWLPSRCEVIPQDVPELIGSEKEQAGWFDLVQRLVRRRHEERVLTLTDTARDRFVSFRRRVQGILNDSEKPEHLRSWVSKAPSHLARLALLLAIIDGLEWVDVTVMERAEALLEYFMAQVESLPIDRTNYMLSPQMRDVDRAVDELSSFLRRHKGHCAPRREVQRARVGGARTGAEVDRLIQRYGETHPGCVIVETYSGVERQLLYAPGFNHQEVSA